MNARKTKQRGKGASRDKKIDRLIGQAMRSHRSKQGLSQTALGELLGVTFQQIQKYERGINSVAAARIPDLCNALGISADELFEGTGIKLRLR
jgi:transcriptional regulator with XRE-family HTH domain